MTEEIEESQTQPEPMVSMPQAQFDRLIEDADKLRRLEEAGVDNWEGYDEAMRSEPEDDEDESETEESK